MSKEKPLSIDEFPLTERTARKIIIDLAKNHSNRVKLSKHAKIRMSQRGISIRQVFSVLCSKHNIFTEGPFQEPNGDWKFNIKGVAAGDVITLTIALKSHNYAPLAFIVTVWVKG